MFIKFIAITSDKNVSFGSLEEVGCEEAAPLQHSRLPDHLWWCHQQVHRRLWKCWYHLIPSRYNSISYKQARTCCISSKLFLRFCFGPKKLQKIWKNFLLSTFNHPLHVIDALFKFVWPRTAIQLLFHQSLYNMLSLLFVHW